jgi:hypothetical protein
MKQANYKILSPDGSMIEAFAEFDDLYDFVSPMFGDQLFDFMAVLHPDGQRCSMVVLDSFGDTARNDIATEVYRATSKYMGSPEERVKQCVIHGVAVLFDRDVTAD